MTGAARVSAAPDESTMLQVRLPKDLVKEIDHLCIDLELFRAGLVTILLREALDARAARVGGGGA